MALIDEWSTGHLGPKPFEMRTEPKFLLSHEAESPRCSFFFFSFEGQGKSDASNMFKFQPDDGTD